MQRLPYFAMSLLYSLMVCLAASPAVTAADPSAVGLLVVNDARLKSTDRDRLHRLALEAATGRWSTIVDLTGRPGLFTSRTEIAVSEDARKKAVSAGLVKAKGMMDYLKFDAAIAELQQLEREVWKSPELMRQSSAIGELYLYKAIAQRNTKQPAKARRSMERAILLNPTLKVDAILYPPNVVRLFDESMKRVAARTRRKLTVESVPTGATIWIDGRLAGQAPVTLSLSIGRHAVVVELENFVTEGRGVTIRSKGVTRVTQTLNPVFPAESTLLTNPGGAFGADYLSFISRTARVDPIFLVIANAASPSRVSLTTSIVVRDQDQTPPLEPRTFLLSTLDAKLPPYFQSAIPPVNLTPLLPESVASAVAPEPPAEPIESITESRSLFGRWWFWAVVAAAGGGASAAVLLPRDANNGQVEITINP